MKSFGRHSFTEASFIKVIYLLQEIPCSNPLRFSLTSITAGEGGKFKKYFFVVYFYKRFFKKYLVQIANVFLLLLFQLWVANLNNTFLLFFYLQKALQEIPCSNR